MPNVSTKTSDGTYYVPYNINVTEYNNNPGNITIRGFLPNLNFETDGTINNYTFPGQSGPTTISPYAIVFQGFFIAPNTGNYNLTTDITTDDFCWIWTGTKAYKTWNINNFDALSIYNAYSGIAQFAAAAGDLVPVTILWVNRGALGRLAINFYNFATSTRVTNTTGYFQQSACDSRFVYNITC